MDRQQKKFLNWARRSLRHLDPPRCQEILAEIESYLFKTQKSQNISYHYLLESRVNRVQFLNGFLLKFGERPLPLPRRFWQTFLITIASLFIAGSLLLWGLFHYISSQFDFNLDDGKFKFFGRTLDTKQIDLTYTNANSFAKKYVRQSSSIAPATHFKIKLHHTKTTIAYHKEEQNSYTIECEIEHDQELSLTSEKKVFSITTGGESNCELTLPRTSTLKVDFSQGRLTIERPTSSFKINGNNGQITWIKDQNTKFKIFL